MNNSPPVEKSTPAISSEARGTSVARKRRRWPLWALAFLGVVAASIWVARGAIIARIESIAVHELAQRGIYLQYSGRSWSPWRGLRLENAVLHRDASLNHPVMEMSALAVGMPWPEHFNASAFITHWRMSDATLKLHDDAGTVAFEHVTTVIIARTDRVDVPRLESRNGPLAISLSGKVLLAADSEDTPATPFVLDLSSLRSALAVLDFKSSHESFTVQGPCTLDFRGTECVWQADLTGAGKSVVWQGIPLRSVNVKAQLSSAGMDLSSDLQFNNGSANLTASRKAWDATPLSISGTATDASGGQQDRFSASYTGATQTLTIGSLTGKINLLEFLRNFPLLAPYLPGSVQFKRFPDLEVKDFACSFATASPTWKLGSLHLRSPADLSVVLADQPLKIEGLEGDASYAEKTWKLQFKTGRTSWRDVVLRGSELDATVASTRLKSTLALRLPIGSMTLALSSEDWTHGPTQITGSLTDAHNQTDRFAARYDQSSGALHVAHLDGRANLLEFAANFPGMGARLPDAWKLRTFPEIDVKDLIYRPGKFPTFESIRLVSPADLSTSFNGHPLEINHLTGLIAYDGKAWQLTHLNGEVFGGQLTVDGSYDDGTLRRATIAGANLHLAQLKPWMGDSQGSLGEAILNLDYRGAIGLGPSRLTGTGSLRMENAPLVKVPLLDQTYALFSVLTSVVQRRGPGRLTATFSATDGVATISQFSATSDAVKVTAKGTVNLVQRKVSARAHGELRGLVGAVTRPLSHSLEMEVSGSLDNIRVRPTGLGGMLKGGLAGTASLLPGAAKETSKLPGDLLRDGIALPFRALELFKPDAPPAKK